jgi:uncharacterized tellurite resistance protein B-like protein
MIKEFISRLFAADPDPAPLPDREGAMALTAIMLRVAHSDHFQTVEEVERIDRVLMSHYDMDAFEAQSLRLEAEKVEAAAPDTVRFTRALKERVPMEERIGLMVALWEVALADGDRDAHEDQLIRQVAALLGVSDVDSARARQMAGLS